MNIPAVLGVFKIIRSPGTASKDPDGAAADLLERNTGVKVLRHRVAKPGCGAEIMAHFGERVSSPSQIAIIGDRLFTDVAMANRMGAYAIWIKRGTIPDRGLVTRLEYGLSSLLEAGGFRAPAPSPAD
ncbi:hypothetical protein FH972_024545 [Carpinus fangiana]|uniref:Uncharacterized protein n=1 Tax=Carpinus fangiana TaxID=176857 RepID=A0A5N6KYM8_9ROSI|nr:hypothetical protein FH972_024545 [Carpinus fangiana]